MTGDPAVSAGSAAMSFRRGVFLAAVLKMPLIAIMQFCDTPGAPQGPVRVFRAAAITVELFFLGRAAYGAWKLAGYASDVRAVALRVAAIFRVIAPFAIGLSAVLALRMVGGVSGDSLLHGRFEAIAGSLGPDALAVATASVASSLAPASRRVRWGSLLLAVLAAADLGVQCFAPERIRLVAAVLPSVGLWALLLLVLGWLRSAVDGSAPRRA